MSWTEAETERLREMHRKGESFSTIARALHKTRNACIGKAQRLGLDHRTAGRHSMPAIKLHSRQVVANAERAGRDERDLKILDMLARGHGFARVAGVFNVSHQYIEDLWNEREAQDPGGEAVA